jgi:hypothetical protein
MLLSGMAFSQTVDLGVLKSFGAYTGIGAVTNTGGTLMGDVGSNTSTPTGIFQGNIHGIDSTTTQARLDLHRLYTHLNSISVGFPSHAATFGGGEVLSPGVYYIASAASIGGNLTLDGGGDPDAFFIIKTNGALTAAAGTNMILTGGVLPCNVFFIANGAITAAAGSNVKGTLFSRIGAVNLAANANFEGRMFTFSGAITVTGANATLPIFTNTIPIPCEIETEIVVSELCPGICNDCPDESEVLGCTYSYSFNFDSNATMDDGSCDSTPTSQIIPLRHGWSMFSTYITPTSTNIIDVLHPIIENIAVVKNYVGDAYIPVWGFNNLSDVEPGYGYQIKIDTTGVDTESNQELELHIYGTYDHVTPAPIQLTAGWNIIGYVRTDEVSPVVVFAYLHGSGNLAIAKNDVGGAYLPEWGFNALGLMMPGKAYSIKILEADSLLYLPMNE